MDKKLLSIVIPAYNEEKNIPLIYQELRKVLEKVADKYDYEIIFVNDGSKDNTWEEIVKLAKKDKKVKGINFSRNFGKEIALTAGIEYAKGDAVITMDADGQRPAILILDFLKRWEEGCEIVYGIRTKMRRGMLRRLGSYVFNKLMQLIGDIKFETAITDFMLIDKKVINYIIKFKEKKRIFRGIVLSLGFSQCKIFFEEPERLYGVSGWGFKKLYDLAINSITSFSVFPLKFVGYLGIFIVLSSAILLIFMFIHRFMLGNSLNITNTAFFVVFNLFLSGITLVALGIIALYLARIHEETLGRPMYVIKEEINLDR